MLLSIQGIVSEKSRELNIDALRAIIVQELENARLKVKIGLRGEIIWQTDLRICKGVSGKSLWGTWGTITIKPNSSGGAGVYFIFTPVLWLVIGMAVSVYGVIRVYRIFAQSELSDLLFALLLVFTFISSLLSFKSHMRKFIKRQIKKVE